MTSTFSSDPACQVDPWIRICPDLRPDRWTSTEEESFRTSPWDPRLNNKNYDRQWSTGNDSVVDKQLKVSHSDDCNMLTFCTNVGHKPRLSPFGQNICVDHEDPFTQASDSAAYCGSRRAKSSRIHLPLNAIATAAPIRTTLSLHLWVDLTTLGWRN